MTPHSTTPFTPRPAAAAAAVDNHVRISACLESWRCRDRIPVTSKVAVEEAKVTSSGFAVTDPLSSARAQVGSLLSSMCASPFHVIG